MTDEASAPETTLFFDPDAGPRGESVPLDWPLIYGGTRYAAIAVRRPTGAEVRAYVAQLARVEKAGGDLDSVPLPIFDAPAEVMAGLDADDDDKVMAVAERFLPRRFRAASPANAHGPASGEASSPA